MSLRIEAPRVQELASKLARMTGESISDAVEKAIEERLAREERKEKEKAGQAELLNELRAIRRRISKLPVYDNRTPDEIIGYNENGLPT